MILECFWTKVFWFKIQMYYPLIINVTDWVDVLWIISCQNVFKICNELLKIFEDYFVVVCESWLGKSAFSLSQNGRHIILDWLSTIWNNFWEMYLKSAILNIFFFNLWGKYWSWDGRHPSIGSMILKC